MGYFVLNNGNFSGANARLRREDCEFVKHDKLFSKWKILVGPSDWREGQLGAGRNYNVSAGRYYMQNVPAMESGPGVFELGVITAPQHSHRAHDNLKREDVIPVYVGRAANIRQRLQTFGQAGAHLEPSSRSAKLYQGDHEDSELFCGSSSTSPPRMVQSGGGQAKSSPGRGPRLFSEVFALGSSIAFRWAHTDSKVVAEQVQAELLVVFDYAWNNKGLNSNRRSRDILAKLFMAWPTKKESNTSSWSPIFSSKRSPFRLICGRNAVGIKVALRKPQEYNNNPTTTTTTIYKSNLCFLMTVQPQVFSPGQLKCCAQTARGLPCNAPPVRGRNHCLQHYNGMIKTRVTPSGRTQHKNIPGTKECNEREPNYGAARWRLGMCLGRQFCFFPTRRLYKRAGNVKEEQPASVERRRPFSLSFNTWVKMETDDQRVHNNGDIITEPTYNIGGVSLHQEKGQPATSGRISGIMVPKRRVRRM